MSHSFNKIWIHAIWATKERQSFILPKVEQKIHQYMREQLVELGNPVRIINGMPDHVHCLFLLSPKKTIMDVIKQVKGSTSYWINDQDLIPEKFSWQTGYAAYSVSESQLQRVFEYIKHQKRHHQKRTFKEEYDQFLQITRALE